MKVEEVRNKYLSFMKSKGHEIIPSASLVPKEDSTTLFIGSGMQPLVPYLLGESHPKGEKISNSQKCFRAGDICEVGDNRHTTFFEMLGNWSLGAYFKKEQIVNVFEFLTDPNIGLGLPPEKIYVTVFSGEDEYNIPRDNESVHIWKACFESAGTEAGVAEILTEDAGYAIGMNPGDRIFFYNSEKNWWSRSGVPRNMPSGEPGGPDTEVFFDFGEEFTDPKYKNLKPHPNSDSGRFVEIGNSVFMQFIKDGEKFKELPKKNVDFGGGLERLTSATLGNPDVFLTDVFERCIESLGGISEYRKNPKSRRIIMDHMRAAVFMIADGVTPSNTDKGYILRRLLRITIFQLVYCLKLNIQIKDLALSFVEVYKDKYSEVDNDNLSQILEDELDAFNITLDKGFKRFTTMSANRKITEKDAFELFSTYGFPFDITKNLAEGMGVELDENLFIGMMDIHREESRKGSGIKFKSGLADESNESIKYHTATHLLQQALIDVLGDEVKQRGSNITKDRLRFDFSFHRKMTAEEISNVENLVNQKIKEGLEVVCKAMSKDDAIATGAIHQFDDKYDDEVSIYFIGGYSKEFCSGPHVKNTKEIGVLKIKKEESVSTGTRRIRAVLI